MNWNALNAIIIILLGLAYAHMETAYFGYNLTPKTDAECICDGIAVVIVAIGLATVNAKW